MNRIASFIIIFLLTPIYIVVFIFLLLQGIKPLYFSKRIGVHGIDYFYMYKFTSIKNNDKNSYLTPKNSENFFYFSNFLRKSKIDELPQFFNILFGHMNFVGPRPNLHELITKYDRKDKEIILSVKPGLTDLSTIIYGIDSDKHIVSLDVDNYFETVEKKKFFIEKYM